MKNPVILILCVLILGGAGFVAYDLVQNQGVSSRDLFPVQSFISDPQNHAGNRYRLDAQVDDQLGWREGLGKLITLTPLSDSQVSLPVFLPEEHAQNMRMGQRYRVEVLVGNHGLLTVLSMEKF